MRRDPRLASRSPGPTVNLLKAYRKGMNIFFATMKAITKRNEPIEKSRTVKHGNCDLSCSIISETKRFIVIRLLHTVRLIAKIGNEVKALDELSDDAVDIKGPLGIPQRQS